MQKRLFRFSFFAALFLFSHPTYAVPPPDFLIQVASQLGNFFVIGLAFLSFFFTTSYQFLKIHIGNYRKTFIWVSIVLVLSLSLLGAYIGDSLYRDTEQDKANQEWTKEVKIPETSKPAQKKAVVPISE